MQAAPSFINMPENQLWEAVLNQWWTRVCHLLSSVHTVTDGEFTKFDNMSEPRYRKIAAMGIASLVSTGRHEVLDRLPSEICNMWLDVFGELREVVSTDGDEYVLCQMRLHVDTDLSTVPRLSCTGTSPLMRISMERRTQSSTND